MKKCLIVVFWFMSTAVFAQVGVSYHQSNLPFFGVNYEFAEKFLAEVRLGTDSYFEDVSLEGVFTYQFVNKEDYEVYIGVGGRIQNLEGLVIPFGVNIFPFEQKKFGAHIELSPIITGENGNVLRGSWGIRYRFLK